MVLHPLSPISCRLRRVMTLHALQLQREVGENESILIRIDVISPGQEARCHARHPALLRGDVLRPRARRRAQSSYQPRKQMPEGCKPSKPGNAALRLSGRAMYTRHASCILTLAAFALNLTEDDLSKGANACFATRLCIWSETADKAQMKPTSHPIQSRITMNFELQ